MNLERSFSRLKFGIYLDPKTEQTIRTKLDHLGELAPNNAKIDLTMSMPFRQIKGELTIKAHGYTFKACAKDLDPLTLYESLEDQILKQLNNWKKKRVFDNNPSYNYAH